MKFRRWLSKNLLRIEHRSSLGDSYSSWLLSQAAGGSTITAADVKKSAAIESVASLFGRSLSQSLVTPEGDPRTRPITADILLQVGRQCVREGEWLAEIRVAGDRVQLLPVTDWQVMGDMVDPAQWRVRIDQATPSGGIVTRMLSYESCVHVQYASSPSHPWVGSPAWSMASDSARLMAGLERRLSEECGSVVASLLPVPSGIDTGSDENDDPLAALRSDISKSKGAPLLVETTNGGFEQGKLSAPQSDWKAQRLGANPPRELLELRRDVERSLLAACGVSPALFSDGATASQQAWRQYLRGTLMPFSRRVERELSLKLDLEIRLDLAHLTSSDALPQSRIVRTLTESGVSLSEAMKIAGLDD